MDSQTLAAHHLAMLADSGITREHATLRGYETIDDRNRLAELKIAKAGRNTPGLLVPQLRADGSTWGCQYRPDVPRLRRGKTVKYETPWQQRNGLDIPPGVGPMLDDPSIALWITEGVKKADSGAIHGLCIVALSGVWNWLHTNAAGGKMALPDWRDIALNNNRRVILAFDGDVARKESVQKSLHALAQYLAFRGARVEYLWLPDTDDKTGLDDYLTAGHTVEELMRLVKPTPPPRTEKPQAAPEPAKHEPKPQPVAPATLDRLHKRFQHWFGEHYDLDAIDATLAAAAVERLNGDPVWLLIISGPGATKTETVITLKDLDDKTRVVSTISSVGALLSATARRERAKDATGGLLKELEPRGIMVIKDLTSILSLPQQLRAPILSALREVYDGHYVRDAGVDGGTKILWTGRIVIIGAVTTVWDDAHTAIAEMGDRFVLLRVDSTKDRRARGTRAINNTGSETEMREELNRLVRGVLANVNPQSAPTPTEEETAVLVAAADVVALARTAVKHDYRGDVVDAQAPELPTRLAKQLTQVFRGAVAIGISRREALRLAIRCARDTVPPLRLAIIDDLTAHPHSTPTEVRRRLAKPRATVDRQLQALHILGVVELDEIETLGPSGKTQTHWYYTLTDKVDPDVLRLDTVTRETTTWGYGDKEERKKEEGDSHHSPSCFSGNGQHCSCVKCGTALIRQASRERGLCLECWTTSRPTPRTEPVRRASATAAERSDTGVNARQ